MVTSEIFTDAYGNPFVKYYQNGKMICEEKIFIGQSISDILEQIEEKKRLLSLNYRSNTTLRSGGNV